MQELTSPLVNLPEDPVASVAQPEFPVVLRGYDRDAVDEYVERTTQLVAELNATRSPESAIRRALERVGEEVSAILKRAHETAGRLTAQSRAEAEERLTRAHAEAEEHLVRARDEAELLKRSAREEAVEVERAARQRVRELDAEADRIWAERDRIVADIRKLAEELGALSAAASSRFPAEATGESDALPEEAVVEDGVPAEAVVEDAVPAEAVGSQPVPEGAGAVPDDQPGPVAASVVEEPGPAAEEPGPAAEERLDPTGEVLSPARARVIDLLHLGRERVIGCWQVGDVLIDPGPASCLPRLLEELGGERPRALLLTHIHLDHAGATGALIEHWPELDVYVHERGAPHLIDPTRLLESARRLYGEDMDRLWGEVAAVPRENLRVLRDGERLLGGSFEVAYTPGHASHHVAYLHDGIAFVGDIGGVRLTPQTLTVPPTPPPDIDIEAWHGSIDRVLAWKPELLAITHFGSSEAVEAQLAELSDRLDNWAALVRTEDLPTFIDTVRMEIEANAGPELLGAYEQAAPPEQIYRGLERYWRKREEGRLPRAADPPPPAQPSTHAGRSSRAAGS